MLALVASLAAFGCATGSSDIDEGDDDGSSSNSGSSVGGSAAGGGEVGGSSAGGSSAGGSSAGGSASGGSASGGSAAGGSAAGGSASGGSGGDPGPDCGNGVIDVGEDCDGSAMGTGTCADFSHASGVLGCLGNCTYDTADCYTCGDAAIDGPEVCDGTNHGGQDCTTLMHDGGTLLCAGNCLSFNESSCSDCGNNTVEGAEACDGTDLDMQTCGGRGYASGTLQCDSLCAFDESLCVAYQCADLTDNDGDGFTDLTDPGCSGPNDDDESIFADTCGGIGGPVFDVTYADTTQDVLVTGTTAGGQNNFSPTPSIDCGSATGPEVVLFYRVFNQMDVQFYFNYPATSWDTVMYIRQADCTAPLVEICNDDFWLFPDSTSYLNVTMPPGDYYIFIDGWGGASGAFELVIDLP